MRFNRSWNYVKLYIISFAVFVSFAAAMLATSAASALDTKATCNGSTPTLATAILHPKGTIYVNVKTLPLEFDPVDISLKNSSGTVITTSKTCAPTSDGETFQTRKTAFYYLDVGTYSVCYKAKCTATSVTKISTDNFSANSAEILLAPGDISENAQTINVVVRFKNPVSAQDQTYGPQSIQLAEFEGTDANGVVSSANTGQFTLAKNTASNPQTIKAQFSPVHPGAYMVCLTGDLSNCSKLFTKSASSNYTAYIDVSDSDASKLITLSGSGGQPKTCGSEVTGMGWIVCPIVNALTGLNDVVWRVVSSLLTVNPLNQAEPIFQAWGTIRSIANVLFAIFFLVIIFSQLSSVGIDNYGIKKLLPRLIVSAILVNISFVIVQISVDLANVIGSSLYGLLSGMTLGYIPSWVSTAEIILSGSGLAVVGTFVVFGSASAFWLLLPMALMGLLGLFAAILTLIFRQAIIPVLAILAPLAFVAYLLPNTEQWFKKWRDALISMLMLYPMAALIFGGSKFAASVIVAGHEGEYWANLIGLIVLTVPLFSLPFLVRQGGPILSKVGGALSKLAETARKPLTSWGKEHQDEAKSRYLAENANDRNNGQRRFAGARLTRNLNKLRDNSQKTREMDTKTNQARREDQWRESTNGRNGGGAGAIDRSNLAKTNSERITNEANSRFANSAVGMAATDRLGHTAKQTEIDKNNATQRLNANPHTRGLSREIIRGGLRNQTDQLDIEHEVAGDATPGGGQDLHQALSEAKGQSVVDAKDVQTRYVNSAAGQAIEFESGLADKRVEIGTEATKHQVENSQPGAALTDAVAAAKGRSVNDAKDATHRYATSDVGRALDDASNAADYVAGEDKANAAGRAASDPNLFEVRERVAAAEDYLKGAKDQDQHLHTQAMSEAGGAGLVAAGVLSQETVDSIQGARRTADVASIATGSAERVLQQEFQDALTDTTSPEAIANGGVSPTATAAGSIDPYGEQRVQAAGSAARAKARAENVTSAGTSLRDQNYSPDELIDVARGILRGHTPATVEQQEAAIQSIVQSGVEPNMSALLDFVTTPAIAGTEDGIALQKALGQALISSPNKPKFVSGGNLGQLSTGTLGTGADGLILQTLNANKLGTDSFKGMDVDEMRRMERVIGTEPPLNPNPALYTPAEIARVARNTRLGGIIDAATVDGRITEKWGPREFDAMAAIRTRLP